MENKEASKNDLWKAKTDVKPISLPISFTAEEFDNLLREATRRKASDIRIQSGDFIWTELSRKLVPLTDRRLEHAEVQRILRFIYGPTGTNQLAAGNALDIDYEIVTEVGNLQATMRFRVNVTASRVGAIGQGAAIVMRTIPGVPPPWEVLNVPETITSNFFPSYGLVLVIGTTGSGKSTLLAAGNRRRLEDADDPVAIITYEDPIEFVYTGLAAGHMPEPVQAQIGRDIEDFSLAGPNAMRRKANVIVMGECRDKESVSACAEMALSGHATYATLHADTPAEGVARMVSFFPEDSQPAMANKLLSSLRVIVAQKLATAIDGSVLAVRSWLVLDRYVKNRLNETPYFEWGKEITNILQEQGRTFEDQCMIYVKSGQMSFKIFRDTSNMTVPEACAFYEKHGVAIPEEILRQSEEAATEAA